VVAVTRGTSLRIARSGSVTVRVPAKINLHLAVGRRRRDGYHDLQTVFQAVGLWDEVTLTPADRLSVTVNGESAAEVPVGDDNLAARAVRAVAALAGRSPDVDITIDKGIPVAGGMGGGSADAAAALVAADALFDARLDPPSLDRLASGLGSDVPFLLHGGTALGAGRGELLSPVLARGSYHWVVAVAERGLSTPAVYAELDRQRGDRAETWDAVSPADGVLSAVRSGDVVALGRSLHNDMQPAALRLRPGLAAVLDAGRESGAAGGLVSGSGPTVALLARDADQAVGMAASIAGSGLCRTVRHAAAPVPGARIVA
jgi:4-diphosphocytidyl-2-C-methyl-D-erythritol kinase